MIIILFLVSLILQGQYVPTGPHNTISGGGAYIGPGDVSSGAFVWWGLRAYNASQATALVKALQLCTSADASCTDIHVTSSGGLNATDISTAVCNLINTCTVKFLYDQSGNTNCSAACDLTQATIASRPTFMNSCTGSLPCLVFTATQSLLSPNVLTAPTQPYVLALSAIRTGNNTTVMYTESYGGGTVAVGFKNATNTVVGANATQITAAGTDNSWHVIQGLFNNASSILSVDGSNTSGSFGVTALSNGQKLCLGCSAIFGTTGDIVEAGWWGSDVSANFSTMSSNIHSYWGF